MSAKATQYECRHDGCNGSLTDGPEDDSLPEFYEWRECEECGQLYEYDKTAGGLRIDLY